MIEIITRLLVRQQIDFAPSITREPAKNDNLIGKLMFTSYFAAPDRNQSSFSIYELFHIPFKLCNNRVLLARMPAYIGIEHISQHFIHWSREGAKTCDFEVMPTCRESQIRRKEYTDHCLYQILTDSLLQNCRIELFYDKIFIRQIRQFWAISTYNKTKYHSVSIEDLDQHLVIDNEEITIPEIALIKVDNTKVLACDRFIIPKRAVNLGTPINLIYNESIQRDNSALINLQEALHNNTQWPKLPYFSSEMQVVLEVLNNTPPSVVNTDLPLGELHPISIVKISIVGILILVVLFLIYYVFRMKKTTKSRNNLTIMMPLMSKSLEQES